MSSAESNIREVKVVFREEDEEEEEESGAHSVRQLERAQAAAVAVQDFAHRGQSHSTIAAAASEIEHETIRNRGSSNSRRCLVSTTNGNNVIVC